MPGRFRKSSSAEEQNLGKAAGELPVGGTRVEDQEEDVVELSEALPWAFAVLSTAWLVAAFRRGW
jgi:hypothetical protein